MKLNRRCLAFFMALLILLTSFPANIFAYSGEPNFKIDDYDNIKNDKVHYINNEDVEVKEFDKDPTNKDEANNQIADPSVDEKYTLQVDYYIDANGFKVPKFQPYIASIFKNGKMDINKTVDLPIIDGYTAPTPRYTFSRADAANFKDYTKGYVYTPGDTEIKVVHLFQSLTDPEVFENKKETTNKAKVGTKFTFYALQKSETPGFSPEFSSLQVQIPESTKDFKVVFRYLRDANTVTYNTSEGATKIRAKKLYYEQNIPNVIEPKKEGATFLHWIANRDLLKNDGSTVKKGERIRNEDIENLKMPSEDLEFKAIWKEDTEADYTILFYTEKSDYDPSAPFKERYDYVGSKKISKGEVGTSPDLSKVTPDGIKFPDIDKDVTSNPTELAKYYHRNENLIKEKNAGEDGNQKLISSSGNTAFSIYYDREVYELVFERAKDDSFNPIITKDGVRYDAKTNPYTIKARFNQSLAAAWPRDSEIEGWTRNYSGQGWLINYGRFIYRDTPPYRLSASDFINAVNQEGKSFLSRTDVNIGPRQISLGIAQGRVSNNHPVHVDFFKEDFDGVSKLDSSMYYWKSDTKNSSYKFPLPELKGFEGAYDEKAQRVYRKTDSFWETINNGRPDGQVQYVDRLGGQIASNNGYLKLEYTRNKYDLTLHPTKGNATTMQVPYDKPLKDLDLDTKYVPERPQGIPDTYEFKGWALDPVGQNLVKDSAQTMPNYKYDLYDHWAEKDIKWKVTLDPNGGKLNGSSEKVIETVNNGAKISLQSKPTKEGSTFAGWELVLFKRDEKGQLILDGSGSPTIDTSYFDKYHVPIRYAEDNPVAEDIYLKAMWVATNRTYATAYHHFYDLQDNEILDKKKEIKLENLIIGEYAAAMAQFTGEDWLLRDDMPNNEYYQTKIIDENPENNKFDFHYRPFRTRQYNINYIDQNDKNIVPPEKIENGKKDYDAVSYRNIPGYKLTSAPNVELSFELNEKGELTNIKGYGDGDVITNKDSVSFKYEDIRVLKRKSKEAVTPDGYHRIIFRADEGGNISLGDKDQGVKEIIYDVIDGLEFKKLPKVNAFADDSGNYEFDEWNDERFLNDNTPIREDHIFTAKFVLKSSGNEKIVPKGSTPTAKDLLTNYEELEKAGAKFSFEPVNTSTTGEKTVNVTIHYPSGKTGTVTAKIKVVPIVEEVTDPNEEVPDYYTRVIFDATEDGKLNGTDKTTKVYNVYKSTNWKRAKYEGLSIPSAAYKDGTKSFDKWNTLPEDNFEVKEPLTIKASYADVKTIIPYDPSDPMGRPDDRYVRLTFEGTKGINLSDVKSYYIKKDAGITLGDASIIKPTQKPEIGYAFNGWDKDDTTPINTDIVVKAKAVELEDVIEVKDGVSSPEGYVTVKFISGENGAVVEKSYYVNPNKYVTLTPPTDGEINPDTGYEFSAWDRDVTHNQQYKVDTDIKAVFSPTGAISTTPVDGYSKITFEIEGEGGSIVGQNTVYVDPNRRVTLKGPKLDVEVGYYFDSWDPPINQTTFSEDTTIKGRFKAYDDIIPEKTDDGSTNSKPEGYVEVILNNGDDGYIKDDLNTVFYVNPKKNKTLGDILSKFADTDVIAYTGYKFEGNWDKEASEKIDGSELTIYVTAEYTPLKNVIPEKDESGNLNKIPKGYVKVIFDTTDKGSIKDSADTIKNVYVNPTVPVKLYDFKPDIDAKTGYEFVGWTEIINYSVLYSGGEVITARYNELENVLTEEKPGYIKVTLDAGDGGNLKEGAPTTYWVKPKVDVTIPQTEVIEKTGKKFKSWDKPLTMNISDGKEVKITATYDDIDPILPAEGEKPKGYVTVEFITDGNGKLSGTTKYYVNPKADVDLTNNAEGLGFEPAIGYEKGTWEGSMTGPFAEGMKIKHIFNKLKDVYTADESTDKPKGYVTVLFITDGNGTLSGTTKYYVNPNEGVKLGSGVTVPKYTPNQNYVFDTWRETLDMDSEITGDKTYVATFKTDKVTLTYVADKDNPQGVSGDVPVKTDADINQTIRIANEGNLNKPKARFVGWKIGDVVYQPGDEFTITKNEIAYAQWDETMSEVSFEFISQDDRPLPQEVIEQKPINIEKNIGEEFTPQYKFSEVKITDANDQGVWRFVSWDPTSLSIDKDKANNVFTGTWEFVPRGKVNYVFDYVFKNGEEEVLKPEAISADLVDSIEKYEDETLKMPNYPNEYPDTVDDVPGVWKFAGFTKSSEQAGEVHFIGTWKFISNEKVLVRYEYKFVDEDGVTEIERPADFTQTPPEGKEIYKSQNAEVPTTPVANTEEKTDFATYTFLGWEPAYEQEDVQSDVTFAGTWKVVKFDNIKYDAKASMITKNYGENTTPEEIANSIELVGYKGDRSAVKFEISDETTIPNGNQAGRFFVGVDVTYPDGTSDKVYVRILVKDPIKPHEPEPSYPDEPYYPSEPYTPWRPTWHEPTQRTFAPLTPIAPKVEVSKAEPRVERHEAYISGYPDGTVRPDGEITRAEVAAIFTRLAEKNTQGSFVDKFSDVKQGDWFTESIMKLTSKDIIKGYPDGTFKPNNSITRAEFAAIASKYINDKKLATESFVDVPSNHWARDVILQVKAQGWITGYSDGTFKPDAPITRAEAVSIVNRMFDRQADRAFVDEKSFELRKFKDLSTSHWAYYDIYEATNTHYYEKDDHGVERWNKIAN